MHFKWMDVDELLVHNDKLYLNFNFGLYFLIPKSL